MTELIMTDMNESVVFYTRMRRFGTIEVLFTDGETEKSSSALVRKPDKWIKFPMYMGKKNSKSKDRCYRA